MSPAAGAKDGSTSYLPTIAEFEVLDIDPERFDHTAHLYVAWQYLRINELLTAIDRYRSTLRRLVLKLGVPGKYHETITWFFMVAVAERMNGAERDDWDAFQAANPDLFKPGGAFLKSFYSQDRLGSVEARNQFLLPVPGEAC